MENSSTSQPSQLSPKRWPSNAFAIWPTLGTAVAVLAILIGSVIGLLIIATACGLILPKGSPQNFAPEQTTAMFILQDIVYLPMLAFLFFAVPRLAKRSLAELGFAAPRWRDLRYGLIAVCVAWVGVTAAAMLVDAVSHQHHHQNELALFNHLNPMQATIAAITAVVLAPFSEEVLFRFFLFNGLLRYMPMALAVIIDGALFGLAHMQLDVALPLAVCGMVLAATYYRTGSMWANIIAHSGFNGITTAVLLIFHPGKI